MATPWELEACDSNAHNSNTLTMFDPHTRRSHPFMSGAPGAAVSFTQDQLNVFVQLASSSNAERAFSTMNDIYHGRSWGTCLFMSTLCHHLHFALAMICNEV